MAAGALATKQKMKPGYVAALIAAPPGYLQTLSPRSLGVRLVESLVENLDGQYDWLQAFVRTQAELASLVPRIRPALKPQSLLWLTFPKGSSKIQADLTRDKGWDSLAHADLKWINLVSIDETWSVFSLRPYRPGEAHQSFR
jgi:hypothetical protein